MASGETTFEPEISSNYHVGSRSEDFGFGGIPMDSHSPAMSEDSKRNKKDDWVESFDGYCFYPQELTFKSGEDICTRIMEFSLQGPRTVCIISGSGFVSNVTIRHPSSSTDTLTYKGHFQILTVSGCFSPVEIPNSEFGRSGMMTIIMSSGDGSISGGIIAGLMIAAGPVKVLVASFLMEPKKQKSESALTDGEESGPSNTEVPYCSMPDFSKSGEDASMCMEG